MRERGGSGLVLVALAMALLVLAGTLVATPAAAKTPRQKNLDRTINQARKECERSMCIHLPEEEAANCVHECLSPTCFGEVYGAEPLEPGELDHLRSRNFNACTRREGRKEQEASQKERHRKTVVAGGVGRGR